MSNSPLVSYTKLSPNNSGERTHCIDRITPHCVVGQASVESLGNIFEKPSRKASCNYGIGEDGRVGMYVEERNRSWCSSSNPNDQRAVTIECASDKTEPYAFKPVVYDKLIQLCADICKRNGKNKVVWIPDKDKALKYTPASNEMQFTVHRWFANKSCPGAWLMERMNDLTDKVNAILAQPEVVEEQSKAVLEGRNTEEKNHKTEAKLYRVQVGAFSIKENAQRFADTLRGKGFNAIIKDTVINGRKIYRVQVGAFANRLNADALVVSLRREGVQAIVVA